MVDQGLQVRFNEHRCYVEDFRNNGKIIAKGNNNGNLFILDERMLD